MRSYCRFTLVAISGLRGSECCFCLAFLSPGTVPCQGICGASAIMSVYAVTLTNSGTGGMSRPFVNEPGPK